MHRLTQIVIATEREREVADTTADMSPWQVLSNPLRSTDEVHSVGIMFLHTRCNGQHIRVEDNILRCKVYLLCQQSIGTLCYLYTTLVGGCLSLFIETHHHHSSTHAFNITGMTQEDLLTLFQRDTVHDALTLYALQSGHDDLPFTGVDHHRHTGYLRLRGNQVEEGHHLALCI